MTLTSFCAPFVYNRSRQRFQVTNGTQRRLRLNLQKNAMSDSKVGSPSPCCQARNLSRQHNNNSG